MPADAVAKSDAHLGKQPLTEGVPATTVAPVNSSGAGLLSSIGYTVVIVASLLSVQPLIIAMRSRLRQVPVTAVVIWIIVAVPSVLQFPFPAIYEVLHRSRADIVGGGEWWRVATAIVVQDGGVAGCVFNLILLAVAAYVSCKVWGQPGTATLFVVAGVGLNVLAVVFSATDGGGNSGATLPLVASLPAYGLILLRGAERAVAVVAAAVVAVVAIVLIGFNDGHGIAILIGLLVGLSMAWSRSRTLSRAQLEHDQMATNMQQ